MVKCSRSVTESPYHLARYYPGISHFPRYKWSNLELSDPFSFPFSPFPHASWSMSRAGWQVAQGAGLVRAGPQELQADWLPLPALGPGERGGKPGPLHVRRRAHPVRDGRETLVAGRQAEVEVPTRWTSTLSRATGSATRSAGRSGTIPPATRAPTASTTSTSEAMPAPYPWP